MRSVGALRAAARTEFGMLRSLLSDRRGRAPIRSAGGAAPVDRAGRCSGSDPGAAHWPPTPLTGEVRADPAPNGSRDLTMFPPSLAELTAAGGYLDRLGVPVLDEVGLRAAWGQLEALTGSSGRALAVEAEARRIRAREVAASRLLARAVGAQP